MNTLDNTTKLLSHRVNTQFYSSEEKKSSGDGGWGAGEDMEAKKLVIPRPARPAHELPPPRRGG